MPLATASPPRPRTASGNPALNSPPSPSKTWCTRSIASSPKCCTSRTPTPPSVSPWAATRSSPGPCCTRTFSISPSHRRIAAGHPLRPPVQAGRHRFHRGGSRLPERPLHRATTAPPRQRDRRTPSSPHPRSATPTTTREQFPAWLSSLEGAAAAGRQRPRLAAPGHPRPGRTPRAFHVCGRAHHHRQIPRHQCRRGSHGRPGTRPQLGPYPVRPNLPVPRSLRPPHPELRRRKRLPKSYGLSRRRPDPATVTGQRQSRSPACFGRTWNPVRAPKRMCDRVGAGVLAGLPVAGKLRAHEEVAGLNSAQPDGKNDLVVTRVR